MKLRIVKPQVNTDYRPVREKVIQKDEILSLVIDLNLLSVDEFMEKYCFSSSRETEIKEKFHIR